MPWRNDSHAYFQDLNIRFVIKMDMQRNEKQRPKEIRNKFVRARLYQQEKLATKRAKSAERRRRRQEAAEAAKNGNPLPERRKTRTVENSKLQNVTIVPKEGDAEVEAEEGIDEFADHFSRQRSPKLLITTSFNPGVRVKQFILEMLDVFPVAIYYSRRDYGLKKIVKYAINEGFTDLVVFNQDRKEVNGMLVSHLPEGPTAQFRLRNLKLRKEIPHCGESSLHKPEMILNNFDSRLGHRLARLFVSLFPQNPQFRGRQVATFHNQRDFIFFRHHRYVFEEKEKENTTGRITRRLKARLQELGPRFTLKLVSLQKGTFDSKYGDFEWVKKRDMRESKKMFHL